MPPLPPPRFYRPWFLHWNIFIVSNSQSLSGILGGINQEYQLQVSWNTENYAFNLWSYRFIFYFYFVFLCDFFSESWLTFATKILARGVICQIIWAALILSIIMWPTYILWITEPFKTVVVGGSSRHVYSTGGCGWKDGTASFWSCSARTRKMPVIFW